MVYKDLWVVSLPRCTVGPNIVGSCCIRFHTTANADATTPNTVGERMLGVVASVCTQPKDDWHRNRIFSIAAFSTMEGMQHQPLYQVIWNFSTCKYKQQDQTERIWCLFGQQEKKTRYVYYFGEARSKGFATLSECIKVDSFGTRLGTQSQ